MPVARPTMGDCANYNGSAIYMQWTPVPDDREHMKGRVMGYKVNKPDYELIICTRFLGRQFFSF